MGGSGSNPSQNKDPFSASPSPTDQETDSLFILIVEDSALDAFLIGAAITACGLKARTHRVEDGEKAIRLLDEVDADDTMPRPDLVILDINLPKKSGREVLRRLRQGRRCAKTAVIIATTSNSEMEREELLALGANRHFSKPSEYDEFMKLAVVIQELFPAPGAA